jgi:YHS domain-containing protein
MIDEPKVTGVVLVPCAVCQKEIPKSVALSSENQDYVLYFCGPDCYEEWSADAMAVKMQEAGEP